MHSMKNCVLITGSIATASIQCAYTCTISMMGVNFYGYCTIVYGYHTTSIDTNKYWLCSSINASINLYLEAAVLGQAKTTTTNTCQQISQELKRTLYTDTSNIRREFSKLVDETQECVTQAVDIGTLRPFVARKCVDLGDYPKEAATESMKCESVDHLFTALIVLIS